MKDETRFKLLYITYFAAFSGFGTFRNVYLDDLAVSGTVMGVVGAVVTVVGTLAQPVWGVVTDWLGAQRRILVYGTLAAGAAVLLFPAAGLDAVADPVPVLILGAAVFAVFMAPITPILDSLVLSTRTSYGRVRAYGSVAFGVGSFGFGALIAALGSAVIFYGYAIGMVLMATVARGLPARDRNPMGIVGRDARRLVTDRDYLLLLASALLLGVTLLAGNDFFSVYMRRITGGDALTGLAWMLLTTVEAAAFVGLARYTGRYRAMLVGGALLYAAKYAVYASTGSAFVVLASHLVTGASFAAFYLAAVSLAHRFAPDALASTAQTLLWSAVFGLGAGAGQLLGGAIADAAGLRTMYWVFAGFAVAAALVAVPLDAGEAEPAASEGITGPPPQ